MSIQKLRSMFAGLIGGMIPFCGRWFAEWLIPEGGWGVSRMGQGADMEAVGSR